MRVTVYGYFKQLVRSNLRAIIVITVLALLVFLSLAEDCHGFFKYEVNADNSVQHYYSGGYIGFSYSVFTSEYIYADELPAGLSTGFEVFLYAPVFLMLALCFFAPIWNFSIFKKQRNLDLVYSLPLSRTKIGLAHYLSGLVMIFAPTVVLYVCELGYIAAKGGFPFLNAGWIVIHFLVMVLSGWLLYSMYTFVFNEANTVADGVLFILGWSYVFTTWYSCIDLPMYFENYLIPWVFVGELSDLICSAVETTSYDLVKFFQYETVIAFAVFWIVLGILATALLLVLFGKKKSERAGTVSDSVFGYRVLIPLYSVPTVLFGGYGTNWGNTDEAVFTLVLAAVGYIIYQRGFKFKVSDCCVMGAILLLCITAVIKDLHP